MADGSELQSLVLDSVLDSVLELRALSRSQKQDVFLLDFSFSLPLHFQLNLG